MKYNIRLSIRAIIRYEQLAQKSFNSIDYSDEEDLKKLLYCMSMCGSDEIFTYEVFKHLPDKITRKMLEEFRTQGDVMGQFRTEVTEENEKAEDEVGRETRISDMAALLILNGVDAKYVLDEMEIMDLPMLIKAYEVKKKERMESDRMWTYLSMLPHLDPKKKITPKGLILFPWEKEETVQAGKKGIKEGESTLERFLKGDIKFNER